MDGGQMVEKMSGFWISAVKYTSCGLCIVMLAIAYNVQYLLVAELNFGNPLLEVCLSILLIEFILLSAAVGVLNQQFSGRFWSLKKEYGYLTITFRGVLLVGFTIATLISLSTPIYAFYQIPPPAIRFQSQLWTMTLIGLAMSPIVGILAKEFSFLGANSQPKETELSTHLV